MVAAIAVLAIVGGQQARPTAPPPLKNAVIVAANELPAAKRNQAFRRATGEEIAKELGPQRYRAYKTDNFTFICDLKAFGTEGVQDQIAFLSAMQRMVERGDKVLKISDLGSAEASSVRNVLRSRMGSIPPSLQPLIDSPDFKITLKPMSTSSFMANGTRKDVTASPDIDLNAVRTERPNGNRAQAPVAPPTANGEVIERAMRFYWSSDVRKPADRLRAMTEFDEVAQRVLDSEITAHIAQFDTTLKAIWGAFEYVMGDTYAPMNGPFSSMNQALQKGYVKAARSLYEHLGFDSADAAEGWIRGASMSGTINYVNLVFGGETHEGGNQYASLFLRRP